MRIKRNLVLFGLIFTLFWSLKMISIFGQDPTPTPVILPPPAYVRYGVAYNSHQSTGTLRVINWPFGANK